MKTVHDIQLLENVPVIVRAPLNVPIKDGVVADDYRLRRAVPTIEFLASRGARVILISHIGSEGTETLKPVADALGNLVKNVSFCDVTIGERARAAVRALAPGDVLVLENLRRNAGEKKNSKEFAKELAMLGDVFVQDSFDTCHRAHASIVTLPTLLPAYAGLLLVEEIAALTDALSPKHPSLAVIGGAKFATKEILLERLLSKYDHVFVAGALANDFFKAKGYEVGKSLVSGADDTHIRKMLENPKLIIPIDVRVVRSGILPVPTHARIAAVEDVHADDIILDLGPATEMMLQELVPSMKTILWNGPLGKYEDRFVDATHALAEAVATSGSHSVVGGGDTVAALETLKILKKFSFVSTGGGAMLDLLAKGTLPGIEALG